MTETESKSTFWKDSVLPTVAAVVVAGGIVGGFTAYDYAHSAVTPTPDGHSAMRVGPTYVDDMCLPNIVVTNCRELPNGAIVPVPMPAHVPDGNGGDPLP